MLKWLRFDMAFNVALLEVRFGFEVPKIRNNEEQLIYHTEVIYTFRCLPVGCAFFPSFFSNFKLQSSKKHFVKMQFASLCAPFPGCWIFFKTSIDLPVLCLALLFEFHDCSSTDCGLEWSGFEELSLCYPHPVFDPQIITGPPPICTLLTPLDRGAFGGNIEGSCWGSQTTGGGDSLYRQSVENLRTMDESFSHGISL